MPDRDYLLTGRIPSVEDYGLVLSKPSIDLVRTLPREETAAYVRGAAEFQKKHAELLMTGRFTDTEGFTFSGDQAVLAKGFENGKTFGVLLWNTSSQPAAFTLRVPKADCVSASEPGMDRVAAFSTLAPQTVRLLVWKKNRE